MSAEEFVNAYNHLFDETQDGTYEIDKILSKYDSDGNLDLYQIYDELSDEDKGAIESILSLHSDAPYERPTKSAFDIYYDAWLQDDPDSYAQGVLDFYEALKAEGLIDPSNFDDEE